LAAIVATAMSAMVESSVSPLRLSRQRRAGVNALLEELHIRHEQIVADDARSGRSSSQKAGLQFYLRLIKKACCA
jgi:hypothetical protein